MIKKVDFRKRLLKFIFIENNNVIVNYFIDKLNLFFLKICKL